MTLERALAMATSSLLVVANSARSLLEEPAADPTDDEPADAGTAPHRTGDSTAAR